MGDLEESLFCCVLQDDGTARFALNETVHWQLMSNLEKFGAPRLREWDSRPAVKSKL